MRGQMKTALIFFMTSSRSFLFFSFLFVFWTPLVGSIPDVILQCQQKKRQSRQSKHEARVRLSSWLLLGGGPTHEEPSKSAAATGSKYPKSDTSMIRTGGGWVEDELQCAAQRRMFTHTPVKRTSVNNPNLFSKCKNAHHHQQHPA